MTTYAELMIRQRDHSGHGREGYLNETDLDLIDDALAEVD